MAQAGGISGPPGGCGQGGGGLPDSPATPDFFLCDFAGVLPKDDMASMEHPIFSLATRPDLRVLRYARGPVEITVTPSVRGRATLFDKDILIYCISQLMGALNAGQPVSRTLSLRAHDLLVATGRETSGDGYRRLVDAFERLAGTRITTNIATDLTTTTTGFGLIESWRIVRTTQGGRMVQVLVTLSEWLYRAVLSKAVLTLSRDYFRLRKPLERRVYEIARKHCGRQPEWRVGMATLAEKSGSASPLRVFRRMIRDMIAADPLPDYTLAEGPGDIVVVCRRAAPLAPGDGPHLRPATLEEARRRAPGWDVHALAAEWRDVWARTGRAPLRSPDAAFLGWLARRL